MSLITPDFGLFFWQTITLLVVLFVLGKFAWQPILKIIQEREQSVEASLEAAAIAKKTVESMQEEQAQLLAKTQEEREKIITNAMATKNQILETAKVEAQQLSQQLLEEAKIEIATEKKEAVSVLKDQITILAVQIAEKLLEQELTLEHKQQALIKNLLKKAHLN